jgi:hypothetical protein
MKLQTMGVALLGVALLAGQARAAVVTINFDNLGNGAVVTNQYAGVTFSSSGGDVILTTAQNPPYLGSVPNLICSGPVGGPVDCTHDVILTFSTPVNNLTFDAFGNQTPAPGTFALVDVFRVSGGSILNQALNVSHTVHCGSPTLDCLGDPQSLPYVGITQIVIHNNTDTAGTSYDNFSFTVPDTVPEPSTLFLTGLFGIVWAGRRFLARKSL